MATRPLEKLSIMDHSSATRRGFCKGRTTLPARMPMREVRTATRRRLRLETVETAERENAAPESIPR